MATVPGRIIQVGFCINSYSGLLTYSMSGRMAQLLHRDTSRFGPLIRVFTNQSSIPGQGKIINVPVRYKVNMIMPLFINA